MRMLFVLMMLLPLAVSAQINRSARELASEAASDYLVKKVFKGQEYKPVSFSDIRAWTNPRSQVCWTIDHKFIVSGTETVNNKKTPVTKGYHFLFYLDKRMKVLRAEGSPVEIAGL